MGCERDLRYFRPAIDVLLRQLAEAPLDVKADVSFSRERAETAEETVWPLREVAGAYRMRSLPDELPLDHCLSPGMLAFPRAPKQDVNFAGTHSCALLRRNISKTEEELGRGAPAHRRCVLLQSDNSTVENSAF